MFWWSARKSNWNLPRIFKSEERADGLQGEHMNARTLREVPKLVDEKPVTGKPTKRLNANLPSEFYSEVERLADEHGWTITDLIRLALNLLKIGYDAVREGNRLAVVNKRGRVIKEVLLPS
jgi:hypothetical protein